MTGTPAAEVLAIVFQALASDEQEAAFARIKELRLRRLAGTEAEIARFIRALSAVQEQASGQLAVDDYREWQPKLLAEGIDAPPIGQIIKYFGSWKRAKEALGLSDDETAQKIDARFRSRRVGKVHRYRDQTLRETLERCAAYVGHPPLVAEFESWRYREIELAKAQGESIAIPSGSPYRLRFGSWEAALRHFGFTQADIDQAHEAGAARALAQLRPFQRGSAPKLVLSDATPKLPDPLSEQSGNPKKLEN